MAALDILSFWVSVACASCLTYYFPVSPVHDRPIHNIVFALTASSFALLSASKTLPNLFHPPGPRHAGYNALPLQDLTNALGRLQHDGGKATPGRRPEGKVRVTVLTLAVAIICVRLELYRRISKATECTVASLEVWLPLLIAAYDSVRGQKRVNVEAEDTPDHSVYAAARNALGRSLVAPRWRFVLPAFMISYGCYALQGLWASSNTTYICPIVTGETRTVPAMQTAILLLDFCLAIVAYETSPKSDGRGLSGRRASILWSSVFIGVSLVWAGVALVVYTLKPQYRSWLLFSQPQLGLGNFLAIGGTIAIFCFFCISTLHCITAYGALETSVNLTLLMTMIPSVRFLWAYRLPYPPVRPLAMTLTFFMLFLGRHHISRLQSALGDGDQVRLFRQLALFIALCVLIFPIWMKHAYMHFHPIDLLIYEAKRSHDAYLSSAGNTDSLAATVARYEQRYQLHPPPGFDIWFEYAKNRSALVVDEFDQIFDDLLPFRMVSPEDLRRQTWEMVSNPWNEISGITIRNGSAAVQENVLPTHRWMLEGVANLINAFAEYLPDMDLAFNLNDESRVAVPHDDLTTLRNHARNQDRSGAKGWSVNRHEGWLPIPEQEYRSTIFRDMSFRNTFRKYGSVGCPPSSLARSQPFLYSQSHLCHECISPHSLGQFLANWTIAADICHQPDLARLHGFYASPAAFKTSHVLMPVFSQSKPHGYNDILYPSAWNYMDKIMYSPNAEFPDPPFAQKKNDLFWRGATSEGVSSGDHAWRGMARQRLVHMTNNLTSTDHDRFTILLPDIFDHSKFAYQTLPGPAAKELGIRTDTAIVDRISRCGGVGLHDCTDQEAEFHLPGPADFQSHWGHRFLFDLDGGGFSGRFLPFLQSRSLPLKTALFREWYDSRLTAWLHFVPIDLRLKELWSVLAFFGGIDGKMWGSDIRWKAHEKEAEMIAETGRDWVEKAMRKEDMEIYFFRLLLEWGRLTDDKRDELGFVIK